MRNFIFNLIAVLLYISACSQVEEDTGQEGLDSVTVVDVSQPLYELTLEHDFTISQMDYIQLQSVSSILPEESGDFYISDPQSAQFHKFDNVTNYVRSYGRRGQGPGEFSTIASGALSNGHLFGLDGSQYVVHQYDAESGDHMATLNLVNVWNVSPETAIHPFFSKIIPAGDNRFFISSQSRRISARADTVRWYRFSFDETETGDLFLTFPTGDFMYGQSGSNSFSSTNRLTAKSIMYRLESGGFVYGHGSRGLFNFHSPTNDYESSLYIEMPIKGILEEDLNAIITGQNANRPVFLGNRTLEDYDWVPDEWPVWDNYVVDPNGNLWIRMNVNPPDETEWWIISSEGEFLARHLLNDINVTPVIAGNHIYYSQYNDSLGVTEVIRHSYSFN